MTVLRIDTKLIESLRFASRYKEINVSFYTTSKEEYLQLWEKARASEYVYSFNSELWRWESGGSLYYVNISLLVNSKLSQVVLERYFRIKLKVESYTNDLRTNSGECTQEILPEKFNSYKPLVIDIKPPKRLSSVDLKKKNRLSLKGINLPSGERRVELKEKPTKKIERPLTEEEIEKQKTNEQRIKELREQTERTEQQIKEYKERANRNRDTIRTLEQAFITLAESCKIEWFRNKWITVPTQNKVNEIKYWTS